MWINNVIRYLREDVPLRAWIVGVFFLVLCIFSRSLVLTLLLFPLYWQIFFKRDLAPKWW